jgi:hypothetical protein
MALHNRTDRVGALPPTKTMDASHPTAQPTNALVTPLLTDM